MKNTILCSMLAAFVALLFSGCGGAAAVTAKFPGTKDGAKAMLGEFMKPEADRKKLTMELRPTKEDYRSFYSDEHAATRAEAYFNKLWDSGDAVVAPKEGQTELRLFSATPKQLMEFDGDYADFPTAMISLADTLNPNLTLYAFKFVKPGEATGMAFEGLTHINGKWRLFPKPWRFLESK